jgi:GT2 family glycosyltransferase
LNNDAEVHPFWLKELVGALEGDHRVGSAASKILLYDDPTSVNSAGDEFSLFGIAYHRRLRQGDAEFFQEPCYVFSACAAAALYRRELFARIGGLDEAFFAYQEDVDLGFRAQLAGYRCVFVPGALAYHRYHASSSRVRNLRIYLNQRNKYFVLIKNLPMRPFLLCLPLILSFEGFCFLRALVGGHLPAYFRAVRETCALFPEMLRYRRPIQAVRVVSDAYLLGLMRFREPLLILARITRGGFLLAKFTRT